MFAPISRQEAELIQQQAPPSYGQLIAQGVIPPVEDFPTENPNEVRDGLRVTFTNKQQGKITSNKLEAFPILYFRAPPRDRCFTKVYTSVMNPIRNTHDKYCVCFPGRGTSNLDT